MSDKSSHCAVCGKDAAYHCSCRTVSYCSKKCQKRDWKTHKEHCTAVENHNMCTRCEQEIKRGSQCKVPHPESCRVYMGKITGPLLSMQFYICHACGEGCMEVTPKTIHPATPDRPAWTEEHETMYEGTRWCYLGQHSKEPIPDADMRVHRSSDVDLVVNPNLQLQLSTLQQSVRRLTVKDTNHGNLSTYSFEAPLTNLKVLVIDGVKFNKLLLTPETTPNLQVLTLHELGDIDDCNVVITAPMLRHVDISNVEAISTEPISTMLAACTSLETFKSHNLHVHHKMQFAGNEIRWIHICHSDCLHFVSVYAPKLESLELSSCPGLGFVMIKEDHELLSQLAQPMKASRFSVDLSESCISRDAMMYLLVHPRTTSLVPCATFDIAFDESGDESEDMETDDEENDSMEEA